ncbi:hypothetical protein ABHZ32_23280, partial [Bacteroides uniformis]
KGALLNVLRGQNRLVLGGSLHWIFHSLSLNDVCPDSVGHRLSTLSLFHSNIPYTIQFQANKLPDVNKVFLIGNKQYLCEKIETEIDVDGLSKVLKGTFYRIE